MIGGDVTAVSFDIIWQEQQGENPPPPQVWMPPRLTVMSSIDSESDAQRPTDYLEHIGSGTEKRDLIKWLTANANEFACRSDTHTSSVCGNARASNATDHFTALQIWVVWIVLNCICPLIRPCSQRDYFAEALANCEIPVICPFLQSFFPCIQNRSVLARESQGLSAGI